MDTTRVEHIDDQMTDYDKFIPLISDWLEYFDGLFEKQKISIPKRPLSAVIELVELDAIQMGKGEETFSKDTLLSPPWVGYFLRRVFRWYEEKYGKEACTERKDDRIKSYIISKGTKSGKVLITIRRALLLNMFYLLRLKEAHQNRQCT